MWSNKGKALWIISLCPIVMGSNEPANTAFLNIKNISWGLEYEKSMADNRNKARLRQRYADIDFHRPLLLQI